MYMTYEEEDTCHMMMRRIHVINPSMYTHICIYPYIVCVHVPETYGIHIHSNFSSSTSRVCVCVCVSVCVCVCVHIPKHMAYIYVAIFRALQVARGQARQAEVGPYPGLGRQAI